MFARSAVGFGLALVALLVAWLYLPLAQAIAHSWRHDANYSHGPLVVLVAAALAVRQALRRQRPSRGQLSLRADDSSQPLASTLGERLQAVVVLMASLALHGVAWLLDFALLDAVSLVGLMLGLLLYFGGSRLRRDFGFPVILLLFAVPLPLSWYQPLALALQQFVSSASAALLSLGGLSVYREGNVIHLSGLAMEVGAACSGMRQLTAFAALGAVLAHLSARGPRFAALLLLLSAATAAVANIARILLTGVILTLAGRDWADGALHTLEGLATLAMGAVVLMFLALGLARLDDWLPRRKPRASTSIRPNRGEGGGRGDTASAAAIPVGRLLLPLSLVIFAVVAQLAAMRTIAAAPSEQPARLAAPLSTLPREIGPWVGRDESVPPGAEIGDERLHRVYRDRRTGRSVRVWITYSAIGEDRGHHPEVCMAVAGKSEDVGRRGEWKLPGAGPPAAEFFFGTDDGVWTWYWHYALPSTDVSQGSALAKIYRRSRQRKPSVSIQVLADDGGMAALSAARDFAAALDAVLKPLLPSDARRGSDRLSVDTVQVSTSAKRRNRFSLRLDQRFPVGPVFVAAAASVAAPRTFIESHRSTHGEEI